MLFLSKNRTTTFPLCLLNQRFPTYGPRAIPTKFKNIFFFFCGVTRIPWNTTDSVSRFRQLIYAYKDYPNCSTWNLNKEISWTCTNGFEQYFPENIFVLKGNASPKFTRNCNLLNIMYFFFFLLVIWVELFINIKYLLEIDQL